MDLAVDVGPVTSCVLLPIGACAYVAEASVAGAELSVLFNASRFSIAEKTLTLTIPDGLVTDAKVTGGR